MELGDNRDLYNRISYDVRLVAHRVGIQMGAKWSQIPPEDLLKVFHGSKQLQPYLRRFENNWATADLLQQFLHNKRRRNRRSDEETGNGNHEVDGDVEMGDLFTMQDLEDDRDDDNHGEGPSGSGAGAAAV